MKLWDKLKNDEIDFIYCCSCGCNCGVFLNKLDNCYWCVDCAENKEVQEVENEAS